MRTTLDIDEAVLTAARALARDRGVSVGAALSELARRGLVSGATSQRSGFPVFHADAESSPITLELVNEYRDGS